LYPPDASIKQAALKIASKGIQVFPCKNCPENEDEHKKPLTKRGFKDATTDPGRLAAYFTKHPDALIGARADELSGFFVMDVDQLKALDELDRELRREIEKTLTVRTPSGGLHFYFKHVEGVSNKTGALPAGVDVRGGGKGYVIVPPSPGYTVVNRAPIADAPKGLLKIIRTKEKRSAADVGPVSQDATIDLDSIDQIPVGARNTTLTCYGGRDRARGAEREEIEANLLKLNAERCTPPLPESEVRQVAASVSRYPAGKAPPSPEVLAILDEVEAAMWEEEEDFKGNAGNGNWNHLVAALKVARQHGQLVAGGVGFYLDIRTWALGAGAGSTNTTLKVLKRLEKWIRRVEKGSGTKASRFVILRPVSPRAEVRHSNQGGSPNKSISKEEMASVSLSRAPFTAPRLRWSSLGYRPKRGRVRGTRKPRVGPTASPRPPQKRIGPGCNPVVDYLEKVGGAATLEDIADALGTRRARDLTRRRTAHPKSRDGLVTRLENIGVVKVEGNSVALLEQWLDALNDERACAGEIEDYKRDVKRYDDQRRAYRNRHKNKPEEHPANKPLPKDYFEGPVGNRNDVTVDSQTKPQLTSLAKAIRAYLERNPHDACQPPGWLGTTLWAYELHPDKLTPGEARTAIEELGGELYLRERLKAAREGVA